MHKQPTTLDSIFAQQVPLSSNANDLTSLGSLLMQEYDTVSENTFPRSKSPHIPSKKFNRSKETPNNSFQPSESTRFDELHERISNLEQALMQKMSHNEFDRRINEDKIIDMARVREIVHEEIANESKSQKDSTVMFAQLSKQMGEKVDSTTLHELLKHIATRSELKAMLKKVVDKTKKSQERNVKITNDTKLEEKMMMYIKEERKKHEDMLFDQIENIASNLQMNFEQLKNNLKSDISKKKPQRSTIEIDGNKIKTQIQNSTESYIQLQLQTLSEKITATKTQLDSQITKLNSQVQLLIKNVNGSPAFPDPPINTLAPNTIEYENILQSVARTVTREFDEKLFLVCSDLAECKTAWQMSLHSNVGGGGSYAQWVWKSGKLCFGSAVPWNLETVNTDPDNFKHTANAHTIKIQAAGLYEISFAFFTKNKPSIQLVVNGESTLSAINSPSYVVHHGSGLVFDGDGKGEVGNVSGLSLLDFLALPAKSTISIHYHGKRSNGAHGFMALRKL